MVINNKYHCVLGRFAHLGCSVEVWDDLRTSGMLDSEDGLDALRVSWDVLRASGTFFKLFAQDSFDKISFARTFTRETSMGRTHLN
jgi:hypothetical protein